jgi:hypothetical protein
MGDQDQVQSMTKLGVESIFFELDTGTPDQRDITSTE